MVHIKRYSRYGFEIKRGILPRAPTNVQGTELHIPDRKIFEIEGSRDREILL